MKSKQSCVSVLVSCLGPIAMLVILSSVAVAGFMGWKPGFGRRGQGCEAGVHHVSGPVSVKWMSTYQGPPPGITASQAAQFSPDGSRLIVAGMERGPRIRVIAYDTARGTIAWSASHGGGRGRGAHFSAMAVCSSSQRVFFTGWRQGGPEGALSVTLAYDGISGRLLWEAEASEGFSNQGKNLAVSPDGSRVFVLGHIGVPGGSRAAVLAYGAADGRLLWSVTPVEAPGQRFVGSHLAAGGPGQPLMVAGGVYVKQLFKDWRVVALDPGTGELQWELAQTAGEKTEETTRCEPGRREVRVAFLKVCPAGGRVFFGGTCFDRATDQVTLTLVAANPEDGARDWTVKQEEAGNGCHMSAGAAMGATGCPFFVVTKHRGDEARENRATLMAFAGESGKIIWTVGLVGGDVLRQVPPWVQVLPDGSAVVVASESGDSAMPALMTAYQPDSGEKLWEVRSGSERPAAGSPRCLAVSPDSKAFAVTGRLGTQSQGRSAFTTVLYGITSPAPGDVAVPPRPEGAGDPR
jgi:outer membrane protein assembly factor BamB